MSTRTWYRTRHESELPAEPTAEPEPEPEPEPEDDDEERQPTLKELQTQAEQLGLPTYGTKAELASRIQANPAE